MLLVGTNVLPEHGAAAQPQGVPRHPRALSRGQLSPFLLMAQEQSSEQGLLAPSGCEVTLTAPQLFLPAFEGCPLPAPCCLDDTARLLSQQQG